jgi:hypothetical protein
VAFAATWVPCRGPAFGTGDFAGDGESTGIGEDSRPEGMLAEFSCPLSYSVWRDRYLPFPKRVPDYFYVFKYFTYISEYFYVSFYFQTFCTYFLKHVCFW